MCKAAVLLAAPGCRMARRTLRHSGIYRAGKVIVIGAGPAGSMAALSLARQGFNVDVYERRPEPKQDEVSSFV